MHDFDGSHVVRVNRGEPCAGGAMSTVISSEVAVLPSTDSKSTWIVYVCPTCGVSSSTRCSVPDSDTTLSSSAPSLPYFTVPVPSSSLVQVTQAVPGILPGSAARSWMSLPPPLPLQAANIITKLVTAPPPCSRSGIPRLR